MRLQEERSRRLRQAGSDPSAGHQINGKKSLPCELSKGKKEVDHSSSQGSPVVHSPTVNPARCFS